MTAGLVRIGIDLIDGDVEQFDSLERAGLEPSFFTSQQGFQPAPKTSFIHDR